MLVETDNGTASLEHKAIVGPSKSTLAYVAERNESTCLHENIYINIHKSLIHNRQESGHSTNAYQQMNEWTKCDSSIK